MDLDTKLQDRLEEISRNGLENAHTIDFSKEYENSKQILEKGSNSTEWSDEDIEKNLIAYLRYERKSTPQEIEEKFIPYIKRITEQASVSPVSYGSLRESKAEWSEEDEEMLNSIISVVCGVGSQPNGLREKQINWLKSLPERFNIQPKPECDNETEIQRAYREGKNAGRKEVFDHPEEYGLQLRRMYDYETGKRNPEWSEEDKQWLSEVYFAIDHSMYSNDERQAMKNYIDSLRKDRKACGVDEFNPKPGEKFWVRCKTDKSENLWFDKGDERPAHAIQGKDGMMYVVCLDKDGKGNAVPYQSKEKFLEAFEIIEKP